MRRNAEPLRSIRFYARRPITSSSRIGITNTCASGHFNRLIPKHVAYIISTRNKPPARKHFPRSGLISVEIGYTPFESFSASKRGHR